MGGARCRDQRSCGKSGHREKARTASPDSLQKPHWTPDRPGVIRKAHPTQASNRLAGSEVPGFAATLFCETSNAMIDF
jgi:hypothetical protein